MDPGTEAHISPFLIFRFLVGAAGVGSAWVEGGKTAVAKTEVFKNCRRVVRSFSVFMPARESPFASEVNKKPVLTKDRPARW